MCVLRSEQPGHSSVRAVLRHFVPNKGLHPFLATLQMVHRICDVALFLSEQEIQTLTWSDFVAGCTAPELVQYLKERRLYVNEPVEGEREV